MLVLSRKTDERILIDAGGIPILLTIVKIGTGVVRVGFEASDDVKFVREEVALADELAAGLAALGDPRIIIDDVPMPAGDADPGKHREAP